MDLEFLTALPRCGRRHSQDHGEGISHIAQVLKHNFAESLVLSDVFHYIDIPDGRITIRYDISLLLDYKPSLEHHGPIATFLSAEHSDRIPTIGINILSPSNWRDDFRGIVRKTIQIGMEHYVIFLAREIGGPPAPQPPYLCLIVLDKGEPEGYRRLELREVTSYEDSPEINAENTITCETLPFRLGIELLQDEVLVHGQWLPFYRLIFLNREKDRILITAEESAEQRAESFEQEAERLRRRLRELGEEP